MAPPIRPIKERILERIKKDDAGCWIWQGSRFKDGYGAIGIRRTGSKRAHRVSYEAFNGPITDGAWVLHRCDVPACVNPEHLFLGTPSDNTRDMLAKERRHILRGESHPMVRFSERFVWGVRQLRKLGASISEIASMYGLSYFAIHQLCSGRTWRYIDGSKWSAAVKAEWSSTK